MKTSLISGAFLAVVMLLTGPVNAAQDIVEAPQASSVEEWIPATDAEAEDARGGYFVPVVLAIGTGVRVVVVKCSNNTTCRTEALKEAKKLGLTAFRLLETAVTLEAARMIVCKRYKKMC